MAVDTRKWAMVGAGAGFVSWLLAWLYGMIFGPGGAGTVTFVSIGDINVRNQILNGIDTSLASQILNTFGGNFGAVVGGAMGALIMAMIGGIVVALVGRYMYEYLAFAKTPQGRLVSVLLYGSVVGGWIVSFMTKTGGVKLPAVNVILAMVIYFFVVAAAFSYLSTTDLGSKYFQIPQ